MKDGPNSGTTALQLQDAHWRAKLAGIGQKRGRFEALGAEHLSLFTAGESVLLVSFEAAHNLRSFQPDALPMGLRLAEANGWASLTLIALRPSWFRDPAVYAHIDKLVLDGFFDGFDHVVFFGAGMGAYAACAYSAAAPGCTVLALSPQATLDPRIAFWDDRHTSARRLAFAGRYGYAPDMVDAAAQAFVLFDPHEALDAMHAALFTKPHVTKLACPDLGPDSHGSLMALGILTEMLQVAGDGTLTAARFWRLYRARRDYPPYIRRLIARLEDGGRIWLCGLLCREVAQRPNGARFAALLEQLEARLAEFGTRLPPQRRPATPVKTAEPPALRRI